MTDLNFKLSGLTCEACIKLVRNRINKVPGVYKVSIDLATGNTRVCSENNLDLEVIARSLEGAHYSIVK